MMIQIRTMNARGGSNHKNNRRDAKSADTCIYVLKFMND